MKKSVISILLLVQCFNIKAQSGIDSTNPAGGNPPVVFTVFSKAAPAGSNTMFFSYAFYASTCQWQRSVDNGLTWVTIVPNHDSYGSDTLVLLNVTNSMNGYLYRSVWDYFGGFGYPSNNATLIVTNDSLIMFDQPEDQTACAGQTIILSCEAATSGNNLLYQWQQKGPSDTSFVNIPYQNNILTITNVSAGLNGSKFRCLARSNASGAVVTSSEATLTINSQPQIVSDTILNVNCLTCTANLTGIFDTTAFSSYTWNTPNPSAVAPGIYKITAVNNNGCSKTSTVFINRKEDSTLYLTYQAKGKIISSISGSSYQWQTSSNGTVFTNLTNNTYIFGTTTSQLTLYEVPGNLYGYKYRCLVNGNSYSDTTTVKFVSYWTGMQNSSWSVAGNWSNSIIPPPTLDLYILNQPPFNYPVINSNINCRSIYVVPGAGLQVNTPYTLTLTGH